MGIFGKKSAVADVTVSFLGDRTAHVEHTVAPGARDEVAYHSVLLFLMYYGRILFFLSFRDTAEELVDRMSAAIDALASAGPETRIDVTGGWRLAPALEGTPRVTWSASLTSSGPGEYRCKDVKPKDPEDGDAQMTALLFMQHLVDTLEPVERAYLALGVAGMHEYYETGLHWHTSKSLHPAPAYGMSYARRVLAGKPGDHQARTSEMR